MDLQTPETNNVVVFRTIVTNCFKSIAESVSEEEFTNTLTVLKSNPTIAGELHKTMVERLYQSMCADLDNLLDEGSLSSDLEKLVKLKREAFARPDQVSWRPPGDVMEHLSSLDAQKIKQESDQLRKRVEEMEAENERLTKEITEKRFNIRRNEEQVGRNTKAALSALPRMKKNLQQLASMIESLDSPVEHWQ